MHFKIRGFARGKYRTGVSRVSMNTNMQGINGNWGAQAQIRAVNVPHVPPVGLLFSPLMRMLSKNLKPPMLEKDHFMDFKLKFPTFFGSSIGRPKRPDG